MVASSFLIFRSLLFTFAVLFKELVQQHRVHRLVAHGVGFAFVITCHQSWVHLFHFLRYEAELRNAIGVEIVLKILDEEIARKLA